jgi:AAHS family benzoate transporter-like MFS transporter
MNSKDIQAIVDRAPLNRFHARILFWCVLILIFDGYDLAVVGAALPAIMDDMNIAPTSAGIMAGSALFGTMLGAIFLGTLADRVGRPRMLAICVALFSLFTAATGLAKDPVTFSVLRFIAGLGIGGVLPIAAAQMSEFAPQQWRTRMVTIVFAGYSVGGIIVALTAKALITSYGWQSVFFVAALPVVIIPFILRSMPESMAFLARRERHDALLAIGRRLAPHEDLPDGTRFAAPSDAKSQDAPITGLFQEGRPSALL